MDTLYFWVAGGDRRQAALAAALAEDGHRVRTLGLEGAGLPAEAGPEDPAGADCVVLPLPVEGEPGLLYAPLAAEKLPLEPLLAALRPGQLLLGGRVSPAVSALAERYGMTLIDYFAREELAVANAVPTAEGCLRIAMEELPVTIHGARVLVLGFGRVGKAVARRFAALGARVTVAARKWADLAGAEAEGYAAAPMGALLPLLGGYDLAVNTVPAPVLGEGELAALRPGCPVIDLASRPGGVDFAAAGRLGVRTVWALSLPGKEAPVSAGRYIRDAIYHILREIGV